jgi:hypothetical protein
MGREMRNEGPVRAKKVDSVRKFDDFGAGDGKRRGFGQNGAIQGLTIL